MFLGLIQRAQVPSCQINSQTFSILKITEYTEMLFLLLGIQLMI